MFDVYESFSCLDQAAFGELSWDGKVRIVSLWKATCPSNVLHRFWMNEGKANLAQNQHPSLKRFCCTQEHSRHYR